MPELSINTFLHNTILFDFLRSTQTFYQLLSAGLHEVTYVYMTYWHAVCLGEMKKDKSVERGCSSCCSVLWLSCIFIFSQTIYLQNPFQLVLTNSEPGGILQCISVTSDTENVHVRKLWPYNRDCHSARSHTIVICVHVWQMVAQLSDIM